MKKKGIVLSSGGLDSTTTMAIAKNEGYEIYSLTFNYGQRHKIELKKASEVAQFFNVKEHLLIDIDLRKIGGSALTDEIDVPKGRALEDINSNGIPITYVPARNTIFLSFALSWAEVINSYDIFCGAHEVDYSGYPDCRQEYFEAFEKLANLATKIGISGKKIKIHTPLIKMSKTEIIKTGLSLGIDYSITISCYDPTPEGLSCGKCDSCIIRLESFKELGISDPVPYVTQF